MTTPAAGAPAAPTAPPPAAPEQPAPERKPPTQEEFNSLFRRAKDAEEALREAKAKLAEHEAKGLSDVERLTKEVSELRAAAEREKALVGQFDKLLEEELKAVPEKYRGLVPSGSSADKTLWIRNARASGVFGSPPAAPAAEDGRPSPGQGNGTISRKQISEWAKNPAEYEKHRDEIQSAMNSGKLTD